MFEVLQRLVLGEYAYVNCDSQMDIYWIPNLSHFHRQICWTLCTCMWKPQRLANEYKGDQVNHHLNLEFYNLQNRYESMGTLSEIMVTNSFIVIKLAVNQRELMPWYILKYCTGCVIIARLEKLCRSNVWPTFQENI